MFVQQAAVGEVEAGGGDGPDGGSGCDDGVGLSVTDVGAEVAGIGEVERVIGVPDHHAAGWIEVWFASDPTRAAGGGDCASETECGGRKEPLEQDEAHGVLCCQELSMLTTTESGACWAAVEVSLTEGGVEACPVTSVEEA